MLTTLDTEHVYTRQAIERTIANAFVVSFLMANEHNSISVIDDMNGVSDGTQVVKWSRDIQAIIGAMFSTDSDLLVCYTNTVDAVAKRVGWVQFVYGNTGYDVVHDHTEGVAPYMAFVDYVADFFESRCV